MKSRNSTDKSWWSRVCCERSCLPWIHCDLTELCRRQQRSCLWNWYDCDTMLHTRCSKVPCPGSKEIVWTHVALLIDGCRHVVQLESWIEKIWSSSDLSERIAFSDMMIDELSYRKLCLVWQWSVWMRTTRDWHVQTLGAHALINLDVSASPSPPGQKKGPLHFFESITPRHPLPKITSYSINSCRMNVKIVHSRR